MNIFETSRAYSFGRMLAVVGILTSLLPARAPGRRGRLLVYLALMLMAALLLGNIGSPRTRASLRTGRRGAAGTQLRPTGAGQGTNSVAGVLNDDGSIKPGTNGSFDVSGFSMEYRPNGAPHFVTAQTSCGTADWDAQFGLANGTNGTIEALAVSGNSLYVG